MASDAAFALSTPRRALGGALSFAPTAALITTPSPLPSLAYEILGDEDKKAVFDNYGNEKFHSRWQFEQAQRAGKGTSGSDSFYKGSEVRTLTARNFQQRTFKSVTLVEYYAPWCTHCQQMTSEYKKAAIRLSDTVMLGAVNCEQEQALCQSHGIHGYPTIRYIDTRPDSMTTEDYSGAHTSVCPLASLPQPAAAPPAAAALAS